MKLTKIKKEEKMELKINKALMNRSLATAAQVFRKSNLLHKYFKSSKDIQYTERKPEFSTLVSKRGFTKFTPVFTEKHTAMFIEKATPKWEDYRENFGSCPYIEEYKYKPGRDILASLIEDIENENLFKNTIPNNTVQTIKNLTAEYGKEKMKEFQSPKLSKILSKLFSEDSEMIKWYTNECPRTEILEAPSKIYDLVISVLPHHIAGMSYYSSYNHGGEKWDSQGGTSCQDTLLSGSSSTIYQLPGNLLDENLAIAYLTKKKNDDVMQPVYEARQLIRIVQNEKGQFFFIGLRAYGTKTKKAIIMDSLKNRFGNKYFSFDEIEKMKHREEMQTGQYFEQALNSKLFIAPLSQSPVFKKYEECNYCEKLNNHHRIVSPISSSKGKVKEVCPICQGTGYDKKSYTPYTPYNDNAFLWRYSPDKTEIRYTIHPKIVELAFKE